MTIMKIEDIKIGNRRRKDLGDVPSLAESIKTVGLLHPVVVTPDGWLVAGERRIEAHKLLGREHIEATVARDLDEAAKLEQAEREENTCRKDFTPEEAVARGSVYEPFEKHAAKMRQGTRTDVQLPENFTGSSALDKVAAAVGMSRPTYTRAKAVVEAAKEDPALRPIVDLMNQTGKVDRAFRLLQIAKEEKARQHLRENPIALPNDKYRCIVIDPPWPMQKIDREERPNQGKHLDYPTMSIEEIAALPVGDLADFEGCHLYLWVTQKYLPDGIALMAGWGFRYQCLMTWVKPTGMTPYSWMYNTEHVLFGRMGSLPLDRNGLKLSFEAPTTGHSAKPDVFYERVLMASPSPRLEMFARRERAGFVVWGNEVEVRNAA